MIKPIITKFSSSYESVLEPDVTERTAELLNKIELPHTVCTHGDYAQWNILIKPDENLALIDWEHSIIEGFPLIDLIHFLVHSSFDHKSASNDNERILCYRDLMDETTEIGSVYKQCLSYYCDKVGMPKSSIPIFRLLLWVIRLNSQYDTFTMLGNGSPQKEPLRHLMELKLCKEEIRCLS